MPTPPGARDAPFYPDEQDDDARPHLRGDGDSIMADPRHVFTAFSMQFRRDAATRFGVLGCIADEVDDDPPEPGPVGSPAIASVTRMSETIGPIRCPSMAGTSRAAFDRPEYTVSPWVRVRWCPARWG
jgi:hypothetical protein